MIDFYYWPTPNGWKVSILLEELGIPYKMVPVNIGKGDQFDPNFLEISPNNRMPAIVDHDVDGDPVTVFESGAILFYLAEKTGQLIPTTSLGKKEAIEWLFWQTGNQGPMAGQLSHFVNYAVGDNKYSKNESILSNGKIHTHCDELTDPAETNGRSVTRINARFSSSELVHSCPEN